jgi:hypothetical protein
MQLYTVILDYYSVGATVHDESWPSFYSFLFIETVGKIFSAGDQPLANPPTYTCDNTNTK